uniref:Uncharacterized protein n=3 Tax=unclassified bacterial viruses TaxID=12333 RepID=A0AAU6W028_9VIRU
MSIQSQYILGENDTMTRVDHQNVDDILKQNAEERNSGENQQRGSNFRKVASIPLVEVERLKTRAHKDGGPIDLSLIGYDPEHAARFVKYLNDPENRAFRTSTVRV